MVTKDDLLDGLVSYWKFDETSGTTASDSHGENDGSLSNTRIFGTDGKINKGGDFTQGNDYINVSYSDLNRDLFSISTWIKLTATNPSSHEVIMGFGTTDPNRMGLFAKRNAAGNYLSFWSDNTGWIESEVSLTRNEWYHVVFVVDSGNEVKFFVNGDLVSTDSIGNIPSSIPNNIFIGTAPYDTNQHLRGLLDEVAVYNRALSSDEVSTLYDIQKDGLESGSYPFNALSSNALSSFDNNEILYSNLFNNNNQSLYLLNQSIHVSVVDNDLVYYNTSENEWIVSSELTPQGLYVNGIVYLSGIVPVTSLTPNTHYYMDEDGKLTSDKEEMFGGVYVGFSISDSLLILNINIIGDNDIIEQ